VVGGIAGCVAIIGLTILLARRLGDPRIRLNSRKWDIAVALMLWLDNPEGQARPAAFQQALQQLGWSPRRLVLPSRHHFSLADRISRRHST
jgi:nitrate reductase gamma subunit